MKRSVLRGGLRPARRARCARSRSGSALGVQGGQLGTTNPDRADRTPWPRDQEDARNSASARPGHGTKVFPKEPRSAHSGVRSCSSRTPTRCCAFVSRSADGTLEVVLSAIGGHRADTRASLTLGSGMSTPTHELGILVGRIPTGLRRCGWARATGWRTWRRSGAAPTSPGLRFRLCPSVSTRSTPAATCSSGSTRIPGSARQSAVLAPGSERTQVGTLVCSVA